MAIIPGTSDGTVFIANVSLDEELRSVHLQLSELRTFIESALHDPVEAENCFTCPIDHTLMSSGEGCKPCKQCTEDETQTSPCTATSDRQCSPHRRFSRDASQEQKGIVHDDDSLSLNAHGHVFVGHSGNLVESVPDMIDSARKEIAELAASAEEARRKRRPDALLEK